MPPQKASIGCRGPSNWPEKVFFILTNRNRSQSQIGAVEKKRKQIKNALLLNYGILAGLLGAYKPENINSFKQSSNKLLLAK